MDVQVSVEREYWWVPTWKDNDKDAKPCRFRKRMLSGGERVRFLNAIGGQIKMDSEGVLQATVLEVEGLTASGTPVLTARDVCKYGEMYLLILESVTESMSHTGGVDLKNSSLPSPG